MHPIKTVQPTQDQTVDAPQAFPWFHHYSNAYPRMDDQQYEGMTQEDSQRGQHSDQRVDEDGAQAESAKVAS